MLLKQNTVYAVMDRVNHRRVVGHVISSYLIVRRQSYEIYRTTQILGA